MGGASYTSNADLSLYHLGSRTISLAYNGNGATGGSTPNTSSTQIGNLYGSGNQYGGAYCSPLSVTTALNGFTRVGHTFSHWNTKADDSGTSFGQSVSASLWSSSNYATSQTQTLYAIWDVSVFDIKVQVINALGDKVDEVCYDVSYDNSAYVGRTYNSSDANPRSLGSIAYGTTITLSDIVSRQNYCVQEVTVDVGIITGSYNYRVVDSSAMITIHMSLLRYDDEMKYYYIEEGEFPRVMWEMS